VVVAVATAAPRPAGIGSFSGLPGRVRIMLVLVILFPVPPGSFSLFLAGMGGAAAFGLSAPGLPVACVPVPRRGLFPAQVHAEHGVGGFVGFTLRIPLAQRGPRELAASSKGGCRRPGRL
jgi:hypothetical protein